jgi:NADH-quinone oxidoreductase subunit M
VNLVVLAAEGSHPASFPLLTSLVVVPLVGAALVALASKRRPELVRLIAVLSTFVAAGLAAYLLFDFETGEAGYQLVSQHSWISQLGIQWYLGVDGISILMVALTGFLFPIALLATKAEHDDKAFYAWLLVLQAGCFGVFLSLDLFLFFCFFEIVLVPMYFLIAGWGHGKRVYAATKFFLFTMFGSAFMLVGILATVFLHQREAGGDLTFDLVEIAESQLIPAGTTHWLFLAFAIAFAIKVPLFPVHTWLPDAHTEAPTVGSVILAGIMLKLGTYGFLRFGLYLFPEASDWFAPVLVTLGVIGIVYGAIVATTQKDLKRLVAYSSVAHMGFIVLGIFALTSQSLAGSVLQMVNHGLSTGALFILVGFIYERRHTREIAQLGGLAKPAPVLAAIFLIVTMSSIGLPGLNGFVGELLILTGSFLTYRWWTVVATVGVILAAVYLLWAYQRVFQGKAEGENATMKDLRATEVLVMVPLLAGILFLGVYPKPALERIEPSVDALLEHVAEFTGDPQPEVSTEGFETVEEQVHELEQQEAEHGAEEGGH